MFSPANPELWSLDPHTAWVLPADVWKRDPRRVTAALKSTPDEAAFQRAKQINHPGNTYILAAWSVNSHGAQPRTPRVSEPWRAAVPPG